MKPQEWRQQLGDCVRALFLSAEMEYFYSIKMTTERARIYLLQLGIYVRQRRNFRLLGNLGGSNCTRLYKIWNRDLNFTDAQMPNFTAHSKADVKHSDMFIDVLEKYVAPGREQDVIETAKESLDLHRAYFGGMAHVMSQAS